jgi:multiple sugar transport system substrate-binding protein
MKKIFGEIVICMAVLPLALIGCGGKTTQKQLTVMVESGSPGELVAKATAPAFKELTGYDVVIDAVPYTGLYDKMSTELKAASAVHDVATLDVLWLPAFKDGLLTLNDIATAEMKADFLPTMLEGGSLDGNLYGMPMWINCKVLIYRSDWFNDETNKTQFKAQYGYDLEPPRTWQQYKDAAAFFYKDGVYGTAVYGANVGDTVCSWLDHCSQAGAKPLVLNGSNVLIDQKPYVDALQFMCDQFSAGFVPEETLAMASTEVQEMFKNGKLAMQLNWSHQYPGCYAALPGKVAVAPMIGGSAGIASTTGPWYECILKNSKNVDMAKKYLVFMYEHNGDYMEAALKIAGRTSVYERYSAIPGNEHLKAVLDTLGAPQSQNRPATPVWTEMEEIMASAIQSAMSGKATPQAALSAAKADIEKIVK